MSTVPTPPPPAQPSPGVASFFAHFNTYATAFAATVAQEEADAAAHAPFMQRLTDGLQGAAYGFGLVNPVWGADAQLALTAFAMVAESIASLFHHNAPPPPAAVPAAAPAPAAPAAPSGPAVAGANQ